MSDFHILTKEDLEQFRRRLIEEERGSATIEKYMRDVQAFRRYLGRGGRVDKETVISYKNELARRYKRTSVNSMLVAVNRLLDVLGLRECRVRLLPVPRRMFRETEKELSRTEYQRLLAAARRRKDQRLWLLMQTLCCTGLRVSEHCFVTVEALGRGMARVCNKGKERTVFFPAELTRLLQKYCRSQRISSGPVFVTGTGRVMDRSNIWSSMKRLCAEAGVDREKVYPHNLRHLFAVTYYRLERDIVRLADLLGHSSVETTRIYTAVTGAEQRGILSRLGLVGCREWAGT